MYVSCFPTINPFSYLTDSWALYCLNNGMKKEISHLAILNDILKGQTVLSSAEENSLQTIG